VYSKADAITLIYGAIPHGKSKNVFFYLSCSRKKMRQIESKPNPKMLRLPPTRLELKYDDRAELVAKQQQRQLQRQRQGAAAPSTAAAAAAAAAPTAQQREAAIAATRQRLGLQ
jgi:hypothetical protein